MDFHYKDISDGIVHFDGSLKCLYQNYNDVKISCWNHGRHSVNVPHKNLKIKTNIECLTQLFLSKVRRVFSFELRNCFVDMFVLFVCFILRFRFPLCPRPPGPIGTPLYRTNCLRVLASWSPNCKLGALSQPYVVFMGIDTHWLGGPVHNTDNSHSFTNLSKDVWYRTELQLKCNPAWNILFAKPPRN